MGKGEPYPTEHSAMSTAYEPGSASPSPAPEPDPWRHGWRYVKVHLPDGSYDLDQVPLTLEDVLHPEEGDHNLHCDGHDEDCRYLKSVLKARLANDSSALVLSDCRVDFGAPGVRPLGPDVAVFLGVGRVNDWVTFDVAAEGARPVLVVEVTSPDYWKNDFIKKVDFYHRAGVPLYVIVDSNESASRRKIDLYAYRNTPDGYESIELTDRRILLEPVGLWLEVTEGDVGERVSLFDPVSGREYGTYTQEFARAEAEQTRADIEQARAEAEQTRADVEQARADSQQARADAETQSRLELEDRLRKMTEELRLLRELT